MLPTALIVFAKHWTPSKSKTRLIPQWGEHNAAELGRLFLQATLRRVEELFQERWLAFTPAEKRSAFERIAQDRWKLLLQVSGDLGKRLEQAIGDVQRQGMSRVLVIGSDSPDLPLEYLRQAADELNRFDAVLGPANDGGYYLLGFRVPVCSLQGIEWGTDQVLYQTERLLRQHNLTHTQLPIWRDVDLPEDVEALCERLATSKNFDSVLAKLDVEMRELNGNTNDSSKNGTGPLEPHTIKRT